MASARFVPPETTLEAFIEEQANKNTLSKTKRDVSLLKEFMRMKGKHEEFENIEPRELDEILCAFILAVKKKDGEQQVLSLLQGANIHGGTVNISINTVSQQSPNLSVMHSAKRRHYVIESDSD